MKKAEFNDMEEKLLKYLKKISKYEDPYKMQVEG